ncbi:ceramide kinase-like isoform X1 [Haliotis rufescens]|uniref:ceramide kinase-like isoform X1 n=1 Tax=Haliotis rufescens TaxID=6454 RepID=UPI001EAFA165|nr:ceramide kinase-like isoform X1 [Haliotis rufescens]
MASVDTEANISVFGTDTREIPLGVRLAGEFTLSGKTVRLELIDSGLTWRGQGQSTDSRVEWDDVITAYLGGVSRGPGVKARVGVAPQEDRFTLHYIEHQENNILRHKHVTFIGHAGQQKEWLDCVADKTGQGRPKCLLTLVNPIGGQKKGAKLYETIVEPLFALAGIDAKLIITERFRHAEEIAKTYDFSTVDGLIVSGGDGLFQEVLHTLIPRYNEGVDLDDPDAELKLLPIALGTLPTGTGNGISMSCHGCTDLETGALVAVRGKKHYMNIISVHEYPGPLIGYAGCALGYGFWSDLLMKTDDNRWLKTFRYHVGMAKSLASKKREFHAEGEYLPAQRPHRDVRAGEDVDKNAHSEGWVKFSGTYTGINGMLAGFHQVAGQDKLQIGQQGAGINVLLETQTGSIAYLKWLYHFQNMNSKVFHAEHVEEHYVTGYRFRVLEPETTETQAQTEKRDELERTISFEGEFRRTKSKSMDVRVRPRVIQFYASDYEFW